MIVYIDISHFNVYMLKIVYDQLEIPNGPMRTHSIFINWIRNAEVKWAMFILFCQLYCIFTSTFECKPFIVRMNKKKNLYKLCGIKCCAAINVFVCLCWCVRMCAHHYVHQVVFSHSMEIINTWICQPSFLYHHILKPKSSLLPIFLILCLSIHVHIKLDSK